MDLTWVLPLADSWDMHGDFDSGWWIVMMVGMVVFWGAIILGIVWLVRGGFERSGGERRETPTDILDRRFAEGAISVEDYHERRAVIAAGDRPPSESREQRKTD